MSHDYYVSCLFCCRLWKKKISVENNFCPIQRNFSSQFWTWHELTFLSAHGVSWAKAILRIFFDRFCVFFFEQLIVARAVFKISQIPCVPWNMNMNIYFDRCFVLVYILTCKHIGHLHSLTLVLFHKSILVEIVDPRIWLNFTASNNLTSTVWFDSTVFIFTLEWT